MNDHAQTDFAALIGIDWADQQHAVCRLDADAKRAKHSTLDHTPEALAAWVADLRQRFGGRPVAIALEQSRGPLVAALMNHEHIVLFPVNPKQLARFRDALAPSGAKDDPPDAGFLLELLKHHREYLRAWNPDDPATRLLARLVEDRRHLVEQRTKFVQKLKARLKEFYPQALLLIGDDATAQLARDFLRRWTTLDALRRAQAKTVRKFYDNHNCRSSEVLQRRLEIIRDAVPLTTDSAVIDSGARYVTAIVRQLDALADDIGEYELQIQHHFNQHQDAEIFRSAPGAGPALAPRLLVAFGSDRDRYQAAAEVQNCSGTAPVTKQSGRHRSVQRRLASPKFLKQTFHEFAASSILFCDWAKAFYDLQIHRGKRRHAAIRALAYKWIRILFRCWKTRTPYDDQRYLDALKQRNAPLLEFLDKKTKNPPNQT